MKKIYCTVPVLVRDDDDVMFDILLLPIERMGIDLTTETFIEASKYGDKYISIDELYRQGWELVTIVTMPEQIFMGVFKYIESGEKDA